MAAAGVVTLVGSVVAVRYRMDLSDVTSVPMPLAFVAVGGLLVLRQSRNRVGWILLLAGVFASVGFAAFGYASRSFQRPGGLPFGGSAAWTANLIVGAHLLFLVVGLLFLFFPDGRLPSPRWRWLVVTAAVVYGSLALTAALWSVDVTGLFPGRHLHPFLPGQDLALAVDSPFLFAQLGVVVACAVALLMRFRRSRGDERQQLKWFVYTVTVVLIAVFAALIVAENGRFSFLFFSFLPVAIGVAVLRYRLYDIDVVINKTLVYGSLAGFITVVYVAIVVGIGAAIGHGSASNGPNLGLSILATAVVAGAFGPVKERIQRLANRMVYGRRATPYEALSEFSTRMATTYATEDLLPRMARILAEATGARRTEVWLRVGTDLRREAAWGDASEGTGITRTIPVRHQGEELGHLVVRKAPGDTFTPADDHLTSDLASQAGLVLRNVRLVEGLRASRHRIVAAQDAERRRLERDIHDGAQQQMVTLSLAVRMARSKLAGRGKPQLDPMLERVGEEIKVALKELRELAAGIHPAILTERGLGPALESLAERSTVPVTVSATGERLDAQVEVTAYFVVSEALANIGKYAKASRADVTAERRNGSLFVEVADDGVGGADAAKGSGLRGLVDRLAAIDGRLIVDSPPGEGTRLRAEIPCR